MLWRQALVDSIVICFLLMLILKTCPVQHGGDIIVKVQAAALCGSYVAPNARICLRLA